MKFTPEELDYVANDKNNQNDSEEESSSEVLHGSQALFVCLPEKAQSQFRDKGYLDEDGDF